jgi:hydroxymethylglutaryl-CoA lyase
MGCYEVSLGDTLGVGTAADTEKLLRVLLSEIPANKLAGHYHDTYGQAVANVIKSYDMGLRAFDSSVAGLGGCPYAKGATGNVATEDVVYMFERAGVSTGVDPQQLAEVGDWISKEVGQKNGSRAGSALVAKGQTQAATSGAKVSTQPTALNWQVESDDGELRVSRAGNIVRLTLTRMRNGNALSNSMLVGVTNLYETLAQDPSVFQIVLDAEGKFFCTGMDLSASGSTASGDHAIQEDYYHKVEGLFASIMDCPKVTIAAVDGLCFGGGVGLAFACDVRLVSPKARFTMTEIKLGLSPATISRHMVREWGIPLAREAMLSGRTVTPEELKSVGAVHGIASSADTLDVLVSEYLHSLKTSAPQSAAAIKELTRYAWTDPGGEEQTKYIKHVFAQMMVPGSEGEHGMAEFRKKNKKIDWGQFWAERSPAPNTSSTENRC